MSIRTTRAALLGGTAVALAFLALGAAPEPALARIGVTSTSSGEPLGTPPQQAQRVLKVGIDVFANERVQTGPDDRAQLLFTDGSALTVGPNSDMTIDRFVFDPASGTGEIAVSAARGVFRLVGGKITKQGEATMKVGTATLGLRGGIAIIDAQTPGVVDAHFMFGTRMTLTTPEGQRVLTRPGSSIRTLFGQAPNAPALTPTGALSGPLSRLEAPAGRVGAGGAGVDAKVRQTGVNTVNSDRNPGSQESEGNDTKAFLPPALDIVLRPVAGDGRAINQPSFLSYDPNTGEAPRDPLTNTGIAEAGTYGGRLVIKSDGGPEFNLPWQPGLTFDIPENMASSSLGTVSGRGIVSLNEDFYMYALRETTSGQPAYVFGGVPTASSALPLSGVSTREMLDLDGIAPFMPDAVSQLAVVKDAPRSPMFIAHSGTLSATSMGENDQRATWLQASFNADGAGAAQSSFLSINIGQIGSDEDRANTPYASGQGSASLRQGGGTVTRYTSSIATAETTNGTAIYGPAAEYLVFVPDARNDEAPGPATITPSAGTAQPHDTLDKTPYQYVTTAGPGTSPAGLGTYRSDRTISGYTAGQIDVRATDGTITTQNFATSAPGQVEITTSGSNNRAQATMQFEQAGNPYNTYDLKFGSLTGTNANSSAFVDDSHFAMGQSPSTASTNNGNAAVSNIAMVTHQAAGVDADLLPSGVSYCTCEFLSWGYWQGEMKYETGPRAGESDRVHVATWVAGTLPSQAEIPLSGQASYTGHAIGNVNNAGASYVAVGEFKQDWNFGTRSGIATITNFDGGNYSAATGAGVATPRDFTGSLAGTNAAATGRTGSIAGSFYASPTSPIAAQAGSFVINGTGYSAAGTFAADRD